MEEFGKDRADGRIDMVQENAMNAGEELRKRRSSRIVQAVPLVVSGVDALGRQFSEHTSTLIINCHGCRYQSKHYVLKNMWVTLEIPHAEAGLAPRQVRGRVAWIQRPRTVRQLFQVALELELPGNVWGIGFPPEDWGNFVLTVGAKGHAVKDEDIVLSLPEKSAEKLRDAKPRHKRWQPNTRQLRKNGRRNSLRRSPILQRNRDAPSNAFIRKAMSAAG